MAAFITADTWSSGIGTHKTKEGRIICTGVGCLGCFPENNQTEAAELGVCDIDFKGHPFRPWLNDDYVVARGKRTRKTQQKGTESAPKKDEISAECFSKLPLGKSRESAAYLRSIATQTEDKHDDENIVTNFAGLSKETQKVLYSMLKGKDLDIVKENDQFRDSKLSQDSRTLELEDTIEGSKYNSIDNYNYKLANSVNRNVNRTARILENLYLASKKGTALNSYNNILPRERQGSFENSPWDLGENAVCIYFAIEYFNCERMLPDFKVLEIVEALSDVMPAKDIKCVQRVSGMWQIVLPQRSYLPYFRQNGLTIRGRQYKLVDDIDSYCNAIYNE